MSSNYNEYHAQRAARLIDVRGSSVLVVGANNGADCRYFVERGAQEVHGVDIVENVGCDYQVKQTAYFRMSVESMGLPENYYDLVYCIATLEHVSNIDAALREMVRVTKPGGSIYSVASPLWNSRSGHHMACLAPFPWIHLRMGRDEIISRCKGNGIEGERGIPIESLVSYVLESKEFNRRPASDYLRAATAIPDARVVNNLIHNELEDEVFLEQELEAELADRGISRYELRAVAHEFVAIKRPFTFLQACRPIAYWSMGKAGSLFRRSRNLFKRIRGLPG